MRKRRAISIQVYCDLWGEVTMFDLDKYLADLIMNCRSAFGERLLYMGLQGSWLRGEAHENSDIDIMVILEAMPTAPDDERPGRRTDGLSSARDAGRRNQLCQAEPGESVSRTLPPLYPRRQGQERRQVSRHLQKRVLPDPESAFSGKRAIHPQQKESEGSGHGGRPDHFGNGSAAGRL